MILKQSEIKNILVMNLESTSEVILSTPLTRALSAAYPEAKITMLTVALSGAIAELNPYVDRVMIYDKKGEHRGLFGMLEIVGNIRREKFDLAICMNLAVRGAIVAWAAGIPFRAGYDTQYAKLFLTHTVSAANDRIQHQTINHLQVLSSLGITTEDTSLTVAMDEKLEKVMIATLHLNTDKPIVAFCPVNAQNQRKSVSQAKAAEIIGRLAEKVNIYLIGGLAEKPALLTLAELSGLGTDKIFAGVLNLKEVAVFIKQAQVMISIDAGTMHIAQALKVPVVALFGPTDPLVYGPCGNYDVVLTHKSTCMPCTSKDACMYNRCIEDIPVADIVEKVLERVEI